MENQIREFISNLIEILDYLKNNDKTPVFHSDSFVIDEVECYFTTNLVCKDSYSKYEVCIRMTNFCYDSYIFIETFYINTIENKEEVIDGLTPIIKNVFKIMDPLQKNTIVGCKVMTHKEYELRKKLNILFGIELEKCWLCLEPTLEYEKTYCGHRIHSKCANQIYSKNKIKFQCGLCKKEKNHVCTRYD